jgi:hypothetical protein
VDPANAEKQAKKRQRDAEKKEHQRQKLAHGVVNCVESVVALDSASAAANGDASVAQ